MNCWHENMASFGSGAGHTPASFGTKHHRSARWLVEPYGSQLDLDFVGLGVKLRAQRDQLTEWKRIGLK